jgi:hypothetical protein
VFALVAVVNADDANSIIAPPDKAGVVEFLKRIQSGHQDANRPLANILVRGRISQVNVKWQRGMAEPTAETMRPEWLSFTLVQKNDRRRYEQMHLDERELVKVVRLIDSEAYFKLDPSSMDIVGLEQQEMTWNTDIANCFFYEQVHDGKNFQPLLGACQTLIDRLNGKSDLARDYEIRCTTHHDGLLVVELSLDGNRRSFWVDANKGYRVVKTAIHVGESGRNLFHRDESTVSLQEIAPGLFYAENATNFVTETGTVAQRDGSAGWLKRDLAVDEIRFGDFEYDEELFQHSSLPINMGTNVTDWRFDPPLTFVYGREPLEEQILRAAMLEGRPAIPYRSHGLRSYLVWANVVVVTIIGLLIAWRRLAYR